MRLLTSRQGAGIIQTGSAHDPNFGKEENDMELKIPEVILKKRREKKLTQEELAAALGVSPQAVSNWERGGYPDITLLPKIAAFFEITVDELIGSDAVTREEDIRSFTDRYWHMGSTPEAYAAQLKLAKEYYEKYPQDYRIMNCLGQAIIRNMDVLPENHVLLREIHEKIMEGCTDEGYRRDSIHFLCYACSDEELEDRIGKSEMDWSEAIAIGELREERFLLHKRYEEYYSQRNSNDLLIFMQYLGRNNMNYYRPSPTDAFVFTEPERTAEWEKHKMRLLESFDPAGENTVPEAWCGCYGEFCLKAAGASIGCGRVDEGFALLEKAFSLYERWLAIPAGKKMDTGCSAVFGGAQVSKWDDSCSVHIYQADGSRTWTPYLWLFWQLKGDILAGMTKWPWFDTVKEDPRYTALLERAKKLAE